MSATYSGLVFIAAAVSCLLAGSGCKPPTECDDAIEFQAGDVGLYPIQGAIQEFQELIDGVTTVTSPSVLGSGAALVMFSTATFPRGHHRVGFRITKQTLNPGRYLASGSTLYAFDRCTMVARQVVIPERTVDISTGGSFEFELDLDF